MGGTTKTVGQDDRLAPAWAVVLPDGEKLLVRDVEFDLLAKLAKAEHVDELATIVDHPLHRGMVAAKLYREVCRSLGLKPEPTDTKAELESRFVEELAPEPDDPFWAVLVELTVERSDESGDVGDPDELLAELRRRMAAFQWAVVLPDGTTKKLCDLEWALLEIVGARHGRSMAEVEDRPRGGDGAFTADLWRSITENQRQDATTAGMTFAEVMARFVLVDNDKPDLSVLAEADGGEDEFPERDGPETD